MDFQSHKAVLLYPWTSFCGARGKAMVAKLLHMCNFVQVIWQSLPALSVIEVSFYCSRYWISVACACDGFAFAKTWKRITKKIKFKFSTEWCFVFNIRAAVQTWVRQWKYFQEHCHFCGSLPYLFPSFPQNVVCDCRGNVLSTYGAVH